MENALQSPRVKADLTLLTASLIWGSAFVAQRVAAQAFNILVFNGLRFLLGAAVLIPVLFWTRRGNHQPELKRSGSWLAVLLAGLLLAAGSALQHWGLRYTTAGNAGFITGLYVIIIPVLLAVFWRQVMRPAIWAAALMAVVGLFLLSTAGRFRLAPGDAMELAGAFVWALHVILIGWLATRVELLPLSIGQFAICGTLSLLLGMIGEPVIWAGFGEIAWAILYTGIFSVGLGYTLQVAGQKVAPPADAAIILSSEAVFAVFFGWWFLGETLLPVQLLGCALMLAGMLLAQWSGMKARLV
jgi:drug/metabolite transporter (DMT)-like permease